jgi:hypothetical protein
MKFSLVSLLPVFGLFATGLASAPVAGSAAIQKREDYAAEASILDGLLTQVKTQTAAISELRPQLGTLLLLRC